jgi:hypothetical protein
MKDRQRNGQKCALFCLPIPTGRICGCEDGHTLKHDGTSCDECKYMHVPAYLERQNNIMKAAKV